GVRDSGARSADARGRGLRSGRDRHSIAPVEPSASRPPQVSAASRALPLAVAGLLVVVIADLLTGGPTLTIIAVTLLAGVALVLLRAQRILARAARALLAERDA